ncbi:MAG: hypothetical protein LBO77_08565 [Desulfovibrio sp.]|jgi:hypothetical protein|nr:hypothetical protein [Desulfovibrio sp.]
MATLLILLGLAVVCIAALRIAKPEYYSPRCCMSIALQAIKEDEQKRKAAPPAGKSRSGEDAGGA